MKRGKRLSGFPFKWILVLGVLVFLVWLLFFSSKSILKKNCDTDKECFNKALIECKKAKLVDSFDNNLYDYVIKGSKGNDCVLYIKLRKVGEGASVDVVNMFQGKDMMCYIPKDKLNEISFEEMDDLINYCTGSLKEAIYELIINKMYSLIIANMGDIIEGVQKDLYKIK